MDQKSLETLASLKEKLSSQAAESDPPKDKLTADHFKMLADSFNFEVHDSPPKKRRQWIKRLCRRCGTEIFVHIEWKNPPKNCKSCQRINKFWRAKGPSKSGRTEYSVNSVVPGGAPGGGKRR